MASAHEGRGQCAFGAGSKGFDGKAFQAKGGMRQAAKPPNDITANKPCTLPALVWAGKTL
jgi:hypothetical protein